MPVSPGTAFIPVLPDMTKFGAATGAGITKSTAGLGSKLKGTFGTLGLTLGATFAIGFAKSAFAEFQEAEKSLAGFNKALELSGQTAVINQDQFNDWLGDFALGIGASDDALRDMAGQLVSAFDFSRYGPAAQDVLQQVVTSIQDMSAATGLAETRLRKMFLSIMNDPAAAVVQLQKLGVVTEEEADQLTAMADAGEDAAATTVLLDKISAKYAGTAAATATESEKMSAAWGEFKETVGGLLATVLKPLVQLFAGLFKLLADKPGLVQALAAAFVALGIAMKRVAILTFVLNVKGAVVAVAALIAKIYALRVALVSVGGAFGLAAAAVGLFVVALMGSTEQARANEEAIERWAQELADGTTTLELLRAEMEMGAMPEWAAAQFEAALAEAQHRAELIRLTAEFESGRVSVETFREEMLELGRTEEWISAKIAQVTALLEGSGDAVDDSRRAYQRFAGMTRKVFREWADATAESFASFVEDAAAVREAFHLTTREFIRSMRTQVRVARIGFRDLETLMDMDKVGESFRAWLIERGPAYVHAFVAGSAKQQAKLREQWKISTDFVDKYGSKIDSLDDKVKTEVDADDFVAATRLADGYRNRLQSLDGLTVRTTIVTDVVPPGGGAPGRARLAHGGIVRRPTVALIAETGPEAVIPLSRLDDGPLTLRIVDWRNGIARLGDEIDWEDRVRP